jgi:8-oxo-dGTP diphosphatase
MVAAVTHFCAGGPAGAADADVGAPTIVRFCVRCGTAMQTRPVGGRPRRRCPACGAVHFPDPKVGVGVLVLEADTLLLVRRGMAPEQGRWALPAGFLDAGEDPRAAAAREAAEETGLVVEVGELVDVYANPPGSGADLFLLYLARPAGGELRAGDDAADARFFGRAELPELAFASTTDAVRRWLATPVS